jgi:hypothetical protein
LAVMLAGTRRAASLRSPFFDYFLLAKQRK